MGYGTQPRSDALTWRTCLMDEPSALSLTVSKTSLVREKSPQPSDRAVVCPSSTPDESPLSVEVQVLLCLLIGLVQENPSGDILQLSIYRAMDLARRRGISDTDFNRYAERYYKAADLIRQQNPFVQCGMFA